MIFCVTVNLKRVPGVFDLGATVEVVLERDRSLFQLRVILCHLRFDVYRRLVMAASTRKVGRPCLRTFLTAKISKILYTNILIYAQLFTTFALVAPFVPFDQIQIVAEPVLAFMASRRQKVQVWN